MASMQLEAEISLKYYIEIFQPQISLRILVRDSAERN